VLALDKVAVVDPRGLRACARPGGTDRGGAGEPSGEREACSVEPSEVISLSGKIAPKRSLRSKNGIKVLVTTNVRGTL
jgi:hypothetical protein